MIVNHVHSSAVASFTATLASAGHKWLTPLQVMEHLRNSKVSAVEFQAVRDELDTKAGIKDVNAALLQARMKPLTLSHAPYAVEHPIVHRACQQCIETAQSAAV